MLRELPRIEMRGSEKPIVEATKETKPGIFCLLRPLDAEELKAAHFNAWHNLPRGYIFLKHNFQEIDHE